MRHWPSKYRLAFVVALLILSPAFMFHNEDARPAAIKPPVLLVHGLGEDGSGWGILPDLLQEDGYMVFHLDFYEYEDLYNPDKSEQRIEDMVTVVARSIEKITKKTGYNQVNIVAHSFGGVLVRAYIAGWGAVVDESFDYADDINSIVYVATPSFGVHSNRSRLNKLIDNTDYGLFKEKKSLQNMLEWYGDGILDLALWFRDNASTRGVASLSVSSDDDAVVDRYSASLDGELPPFVVSHHVNLKGFSHCAMQAEKTGLPSIIDVDRRKHKLYSLIESFFGGNKDWQKLTRKGRISSGNMIFDLLPSDTFNPTKLQKKAVKLKIILENGSKKTVKVKRSSASMYYARDIEDGMYTITLPYENKRRSFDIEIDVRDSATSFVKFDPANPGDDDEPDGPNLPEEIKDEGSLRRFVRNMYGERAEQLIGPVEFVEFVRQIRDDLVDAYPELELLNNQAARYGYTAPYGKHHDALYYVPTADVIDFVRDSTSGGILLEKLQWARVPPPW